LLFSNIFESFLFKTNGKLWCPHKRWLPIRVGELPLDAACSKGDEFLFEIQQKALFHVHNEAVALWCSTPIGLFHLSTNICSINQELKKIELPHCSLLTRKMDVKV